MVGQTCEVGILFADVCGSTRLYELQGDEKALAAIEACLRLMTDEVTQNGGAIVKMIGDEVMAVFRCPSAMSSAAQALQDRVSALNSLGNDCIEPKLTIRIGMNFGPAIENGSDYYGDTVNIAARIASLAKAGQIITTRQTTDRMPPRWRLASRDLHSVYIKGKAEPVPLVEVIWRDSHDVTVLKVPRLAPSPQRLRLEQHQRVWLFDDHQVRVTLGREATNDVVILDPQASRTHATIERRLYRWVLRDHSTNGTLVTFAGQQPILLNHEELTLARDGTISFGESIGASSMFFKLAGSRGT